MNYDYHRLNDTLTSIEDLLHRRNLFRAGPEHVMPYESRVMYMMTLSFLFHLKGRHFEEANLLYHHLVHKYSIETMQQDKVLVRYRLQLPPFS